MQKSTFISGLLAFGAGALVAALVLQPDLRRALGIAGADATTGLYAPRDWSRGTPSKLNISVFAFSDRNRNGRYDIADKPLNRIAVRMTRPDGTTRIQRSNINGYANFSMQRDGEDADIAELGPAYRFDLLAPEGWTVTTGNARQDIVFKAVDGGVAGMGAANPPDVIGIAPPARVSGHWPGYASETLRVIDPEGRETTVSINAQGDFSFAARPGEWRVAGTPHGDMTFAVDYAPVRLAQPLARNTSAAGLSPTVIDFDDQTRSFIEKLAAGYAGLDWSYLLAVDNQFYKGPGYINGLMSGANVAYNSSGHPVTVRAVEPGDRFDFVGGFFSVAWHNAEGETMIIRAWRKGEVVAEETFALSHLAPLYLHADFRGITRLELETQHYWQFVVDDLIVRLPAG